MTDSAWVARVSGEPHIRLGCDCGWSGPDAAIESWRVESDRDRVVRECPECGRAVPEWGTFRPVDGLLPIAAGPLAAALDEQ